MKKVPLFVVLTLACCAIVEARDTYQEKVALQIKVDNAAAKNNLRSLRVLLRDRRIKDLDAGCPAAYAYKYKNWEMLDLVLSSMPFGNYSCPFLDDSGKIKRKDIIYEKDTHYNGIVEQAIREGDIDTFLRLRKSPDGTIRVLQEDLYYAHKVGQRAIEDYILREHAKKLDGRDSYRGSLLVLYQDEGDAEFINRLLDAGVPPQPTESFASSIISRHIGSIAISRAIERQDLPLVRRLIEAGALVNIEVLTRESLDLTLIDDDLILGESPLCIAARIGDEEIVRELLKAGAYINVLCGRPRVIEPISKEKVLGYDIKVSQGRQQEVATPLMLAREYKRDHVVSILQAAGAGGGQLEPGWQLTTTNCKIRRGTPHFVSRPDWTVAWLGPCPNGIAEGKGRLQWYHRGIRRHLYEGGVKDGLPHGKGRLSDQYEANTIIIANFEWGKPLGEAFRKNNKDEWERVEYDIYGQTRKLPYERGGSGSGGLEETLATGAKIGLGYLALKWLGDALFSGNPVAATGEQDRAADSSSNRSIEEAPGGSKTAEIAKEYLVVRGTVYCRGNYFKEENILVYVNRFGWSTEGTIRTDKNGRFELLTDYTSGLTEQRFKLVGGCGEDEFGTSVSVEDAAIHLR